MRTLKKLFIALMAGLPLVAAWIWWWDGAWDNGAMTTQGLTLTTVFCALALAILGLKTWLKGGSPRC